MYPLGICTSQTHAAALQAAGAVYVEENVQSFLQPEQPNFQVPPTSLPVRMANYFLPAAAPGRSPPDFQKLKPKNNS